MSSVEKADGHRRGYYTSIWDEKHNWLSRGLNVRNAAIALGEESDRNAPLAAILWVNSGPGDPLRGRHVHHSDAINLVVEGAMYMDGHWIRPGQAKVVPAEFNYGDAIPGEEGVIFLEIFADFSGAIPEFEDPECQAYFEEVHGQHLRDH